MLSNIEKRKLLFPGWPGELTNEELEFIREALFREKQLSFRWRFAPSQKTRSTAAILKVAMWGDDDRLHNARLHRKKYLASERVKASENPLSKG